MFLKFLTTTNFGGGELHGEVNFRKLPKLDPLRDVNGPIKMHKNKDYVFVIVDCEEFCNPPISARININ